ncbi:hypothetical protein SK128_023254 [Halocaridina rubra]|uniref:Uncharacterized protein n=1 Tax=Halocaridina rubra TaxID=373956 RepID=A0AAN9ACK9_HALRR
MNDEDLARAGPSGTLRFPPAKKKPSSKRLGRITKAKVALLKTKRKRYLKKTSTSRQVNPIVYAVDTSDSEYMSILEDTSASCVEMEQISSSEDGRQMSLSLEQFPQSSPDLSVQAVASESSSVESDSSNMAKREDLQLCIEQGQFPASARSCSAQAEDSWAPSTESAVTSDIGHFEVNNDIMIKTNFKEKSRVWTPVDPYCLAFGPDDYEPLEDISVTLHMDDYLAMKNEEQLLPSTCEIGYETDSTDAPLECSGIWFQMHQKSGHNQLGNVSLVAPFKSLYNNIVKLQRLKCYFQDIYQSATSCVSRFVFADENQLDLSDTLTSYTPNVLGGAWYEDEETRKSKYAAFIRRYKSKEMYPVKNKVEFFFKYDVGCFRLLYLLLDLLPAEHGNANNGEPDMCTKYRSGFRENWVLCPSPFSLDEAANLVEEDWRLQTFAIYIAWKIKLRGIRKLRKRRCPEEVVDTAVKKCVPYILVTMMEKSKEVCASIYDRELKALAEREYRLLDAQSRLGIVPQEEVYLTEEHLVVLDIVNDNVDRVIHRIINNGININEFYSRVVTGELHMHLRRLLESMAGELFKVIADCLTNLALQMKLILNKEVEKDTMNKMKKTLKRMGRGIL